MLKHKIKYHWAKLLHFLHLKKPDTRPAPALILELLPFVFSISVLLAILNRLHRKEIIARLWLLSPRHMEMRSFPVVQALRMVRKHKWTLVNTEPVRRISRREALKILVKGDTLGKRQVIPIRN